MIVGEARVDIDTGSWGIMGGQRCSMNTLHDIRSMCQDSSNTNGH
jgi:hypothetical protein